MKYLIHLFVSLSLLFISITRVYAQSGYVGEIIHVNAPVVPGTIDGAAWSSDNDNVGVTGDHYGANVKIRGYFSGTAKIECYFAYSYYSGGKVHYATGQRAYYYITCKPSSISLNKKDVTLKPGDYIELEYTNSSGYELPSVHWTTSDRNIANFESYKEEEYGMKIVEVYAKNPGKCTITCDGNNGGNPVSCVINVVATPAKSISISPAELNILPQQQAQLKYVLTPSDAYTTVKWTSSDEGIAKVSSSGKVTGVSHGNAVITATTDNGLTATCNVGVIPYPTSFTLAANKDIYVGYTLQLEPKVYPENAYAACTWESSNSLIASVDQNGAVFAKKAGTVEITATTQNNITARCTVTIKEPSEGMDHRNVTVRNNTIKKLINNSLKNIRR